MSFVDDDSSWTRGVGAIAATDQVSPRRRVAAARAARVMAKRDAVMARSTMGNPLLADANRPIPPKKILPHHRPSLTSVMRNKMIVKAPGSVLPPTSSGQVVTKAPTTIYGTQKIPSSSTGSKSSAGSGSSSSSGSSSGSTSTSTSTTTKTSAISGGGGSGSGSKPPAPAPSPVLPPPEPLPDLPDAAASSATTPQSPKTLLTYAAIGIGAWWLLTRK